MAGLMSLVVTVDRPWVWLVAGYELYAIVDLVEWRQGARVGIKPRGTLHSAETAAIKNTELVQAHQDH